jgi:hypothetical protein
MAMKRTKVARLCLIAVVSALLLGPGLFIPVTGVNAAVAGLVPGGGGVQVINADGYSPYPGSNVSFPTYTCATLSCARDVQAKLDIPTATFPAYVQIFYVVIGICWQNQVFSAVAPRSMMIAPHNLDLGGATFSQYGVYVLAFTNTMKQSTSWQYFQVEPATKNGMTTIVSITGTFKVVKTTILATTASGGINTTDSVTRVARNDSFSPGVITGRITVETVRHVNMTTGNGTSFGVSTFTGFIIGKGPGECTYRISSTITAVGTSHATSYSQHWLTECTGGLQGITETTTPIGSGVFGAVVTYDQPTPAPDAQTVSPYSCAIIAAAVLPILVSAFLFARTKKKH